MQGTYFPFARAADGDNAQMGEQVSTVVVVGASAGGVEALTGLAAGLPADLDAAVLVVLHFPRNVESRLARVVSRAGPLPAEQARDGELLQPGHIYVAPPDHHLIVRDGHAQVARGPHENGFRPSIDVLFRSAAVAYGPHAIAVVLSGARDDGVAGASAIGRRGGCVYVQEPAEALFGTLPALAASQDHPDRVLPLADLGVAVATAVGRFSAGDGMSENAGDDMILESEYAALDAGAMERDGPPGKPSPYGCPACGGVLWEVDDATQLRFRCRAGHAYSAEAATAEQGESVETALWTALRALQERAQLCARLAERTGSAGAARSSERFAVLADEARGQAEAIRRLLAGANGSDD
jgi:two-component system, chemotaxis family, protein-glutamate methylesterase/glutaminase